MFTYLATLIYNTASVIIIIVTNFTFVSVLFQQKKNNWTNKQMSDAVL